MVNGWAARNLAGRDFARIFPRVNPRARRIATVLAILRENGRWALAEDGSALFCARWTATSVGSRFEGKVKELHGAGNQLEKAENDADNREADEAVIRFKENAHHEDDRYAEAEADGARSHTVDGFLLWCLLE